MSTLSQFVGGSPIKSIQRGTIALLANTHSSNTATISSVDTSKSFISWLGGSTNTTALNQWAHRVDLTNSTTVTVTRTTDAGSVTVSYEVIEYN